MHPNVRVSLQVASLYVDNMIAKDGVSLPFSHNLEWATATALTAIDESLDDGKPFFLYFTPTSPHSAAGIEEALTSYSVRDTPAGQYLVFSID